MMPLSLSIHLMTYFLDGKDNARKVNAKSIFFICNTAK
jgi:hypothetical protein